VLTRGVGVTPNGEDPHDGEFGGVNVHRVREPSWPRDLDRFVAWVERMNDDMLAAGEALAQENGYDLIHGHDWLVAPASLALADRLGLPYVTTIHATEHGRHQGWVQDQPQAHIHSVERWMARSADGVIVCSYYMRARWRTSRRCGASSQRRTRSSCYSSAGSSTRRDSS
jgi:glycogen(starch) synthase